MVLGRFTAGWLFQIRQVRWFDVEERHRSLGHVVAREVIVLQVRFVEVSTLVEVSHGR